MPLLNNISQFSLNCFLQLRRPCFILKLRSITQKKINVIVFFINYNVIIMFLLQNFFLLFMYN